MNIDQINKMISEIEDLSSEPVYIANLWEKYGKKRIYVNMCWRVKQGSERRSYRVGYIDLTKEKLIFVFDPSGYPYCAAERRYIKEFLANLCEKYNNVETENNT